jgi:hypothetical protein
VPAYVVGEDDLGAAELASRPAAGDEADACVCVFFFRSAKADHKKVRACRSARRSKPTRTHACTHTA